MCKYYLPTSLTLIISRFRVLLYIKNKPIPVNCKHYVGQGQTRAHRQGDGRQGQIRGRFFRLIPRFLSQTEEPSPCLEEPSPCLSAWIGYRIVLCPILSSAFRDIHPVEFLEFLPESGRVAIPYTFNDFIDGQVGFRQQAFRFLHPQSRDIVYVTAVCFCLE